MFILERAQLPKTGWSMPEPAPDPDGKKLLGSAIIEQDYDSRPGLCNIERDVATDDPVPTPAESAASEPLPSPADEAARNQMQHNSQNCDDVASAPAPHPGLRSCPVPPGVLKARNQHRQYLDPLAAAHESEPKLARFPR